MRCLVIHRTAHAGHDRCGATAVGETDRGPFPCVILQLLHCQEGVACPHIITRARRLKGDGYGVIDLVWRLQHVLSD